MELDPGKLSAFDAETSLRMLKSLEQWPRPTFEQVRNLVMEGKMMIFAPEGATLDDYTIKVFGSLPPGYIRVIREGRAFDLGHLPNDVIKVEAMRGCHLYQAGHIGHPFREPYLIYHTWEEGGSLLMVDPFDWHKWSDGHWPPGTFMICELQPVKIGGSGHALVMADMIHVQLKDNGYYGTVMRNALMPMTQSQLEKAGLIGNLAEPVMATLLLLATDGVAVDRINPDAKLNRAREKARKPPLPGHWRVQAEDYVTAILNRGKRTRGPAGDGHHASPIPHLRRGHTRHLHVRHGGGTVWVRDALINLKDPNAPLSRSFYAMQREKDRD